MSYQRKSIGSPCAACGAPVQSETIAVRTLTRTLPYTPKIWHRGCYDASKAGARPAAASLGLQAAGAR